MAKKEVKTERNINIITKKKALLDILERLMKNLDEWEQDEAKKYTIIGKEEEQARDWRNDELLWEDEEKTIPKYRDKYGYVPIDDDDWTDDKVATVLAIQQVKAALEGMI